MIRAVIFDLGGTLLEYKLPGTNWTQFEQAGAAAALDHLAGQDYRVPPLETFVDSVVAEVQTRWWQVTERGGNLRLAEVLRDVCARCGITLSTKAAEKAAHHYIMPLSAQARPLPAAKETLHSLRAGGRKIGLISNTMWPGRYHLADLARHGLAEYFHHTLFSADTGVWKPHPEVFRRSLAALEVAPDEAVFVGDYLPHDIAGAQAAGMKSVHITSGEFSTDSVEPDGCISTLDELTALLVRWDEKT